MMAQNKILVICENAARFARVRGACGALGRGSLRGVTNPADALEILKDGAISLVVVDESIASDLLAVCELLHAVSLGRSRCRIVVLTEHYNQVDATMFYRLGVADYLEYGEHRGSLTATVASLADMECPSAMELELADRAYPAPKSRRQPTLV